MKKRFLLTLTIAFNFICYSQIEFEKGYYIDNVNQKINCLIKNEDWNNNPSTFKYKLSENSEIKVANIKYVKEFGDNSKTFKYIRNRVNIDRSSENIGNLSSVRKPFFKEEELFLKVLIEGKKSLYQYYERGLRRFFYNKNEKEIAQLIFKSFKRKRDIQLNKEYDYTDTNTKIAQNNQYKQQLLSYLKCNLITTKMLENLTYTKNDLIKIYKDYYKCNNVAYSNYTSKGNKGSFNLNIRPRFNLSSLSIDNLSSFVKYNNSSVGFGAEAEFILPFNKNKWAIAIEPVFQKYKETEESLVPGFTPTSQLRTQVDDIDYTSIEVHTSIRHYLFLNKNSKFFINTSFVIDFPLNLSIKRTGPSLSNFEDSALTTNFGLGIGYKFRDRYSLEIKSQFERDITVSSFSTFTDYKTLSVIFGYTIF